MTGRRFDPQALVRARQDLTPPQVSGRYVPEAEGGCGVTGFACSKPVAGKHIFEPSCQMHNRGNGKGGGIAMVGLDPAALGVDQATLKSHYLLTVAYLEPDSRSELEKAFIQPFFDVAQGGQLPSLDDFRDCPGLEISPPQVWRYFVRVKPQVLDKFAQDKGLDHLDPEAAADEFVFQNSCNLNKAFYESGGRQRAFVLSHGKDMMVLKIVGYAEEVVRFYMLQEFKAHLWIAHQRYPTKGRVWHPGGAHPFVGLHEALVHNGDFANYHAVGEYLRQRNIHSLFLTDTEVSVLLFDLLARGYGYPLEYVIEALAPTSELDLDQVEPEKQAVYSAIQRHHLHAAPDGPWFFIIGRHDPSSDEHLLLGITDTAMLRPQVFALQQGQVEIGLICSEKQAIDATLRSLSQEDPRISPVADLYWNARGGSHTDGGAFIFTLKPDGNGGRKLICSDKFGRVINAPQDQEPRPSLPARIKTGSQESLPPFSSPQDLPQALTAGMKEASYGRVEEIVSGLQALGTKEPWTALAGFEALLDRRFDPGTKRRRSILDVVSAGLNGFFDSLPGPDQGQGPLVRVGWSSRQSLGAPRPGQEALVICARDFPPEGEECDAKLLVRAFGL
ncbi:MAG: glutamate synthase, partial [Deltaproteobacteria bacterium]|nr:glutamate synthase [Deltaproteobacteria bacterium]